MSLVSGRSQAISFVLGILILIFVVAVFNDGEAAIVRSCQGPLGECHCSAKCGGAQSPGSIEISHKAEAIKRGHAFLNLNVLLVRYYRSVTEPDDHPTNPAGQLFTGNIQSRRDIGIGGKRLTVPKNNEFNADLIEGSLCRAVVNGDEIGGNALALPDVGGNSKVARATAKDKSTSVVANARHLPEIAGKP